MIILGTEEVDWALINLSTEFPPNTEIFLHFLFSLTTWDFPKSATNTCCIWFTYSNGDMRTVFFNALKIHCFILKVPLLLFIALPGTQRKSTKGWGIAVAYRCSVEFQCYELFVKDTYDWRQFPLLWKKLLEKDFKHSILMTWYHEGYTHHLHIDHNTPFLSPNILHNHCFPFLFGTGFIKKF